MLKTAVECVPNFSEGKNKKVIKEIANTIKSVSGISVLDIHIDSPHNRSVITFIGEPKNVKEAAFKATKKAAELIDMTKHRGEHPRIGATDVIPIIPLKNISMKDCAKHAEDLAKKISKDLKIPTYLYEHAAKKADRKNLANIRKIGYEKLKSKIKDDPFFKPDFGPAELGKSGATMVGARDFLIAFNVNLKSDDITIAKKIAAQIRESSGGLEGIKAIAINLKNKELVQVSTNITNYKKTGIKKVFQAIEEAANKQGVEVSESEIVGMLPENALSHNYKEVLKLHNFSEKQILSKSS